MKRHITLNVDDELITKAKAKGLVISDVLNEALYDKARPTKQDFADESLKIICAECGEETEKGYRCEWRKIAICDNCHERIYVKKNKIVRCIHRNAEHIHERFGEELGSL